MISQMPKTFACRENIHSSQNRRRPRRGTGRVAEEAVDMSIGMDRVRMNNCRNPLSELTPGETLANFDPEINS
jgi:hypothetical protein